MNLFHSPARDLFPFGLGTPTLAQSTLVRLPLGVPREVIDRLEGVDILSSRERNGSIAIAKVGELAEEETTSTEVSTRYLQIVVSYACRTIHYRAQLKLTQMCGSRSGLIIIEEGF